VATVWMSPSSTPLNDSVAPWLLGMSATGHPTRDQEPVNLN
jgi:hypothetical protein